MNIVTTVLSILFFAVVYFLPTIITYKRRPCEYLDVLAWNLFMGWTVVMWALLLGWSLAPRKVY